MEIRLYRERPSAQRPGKPIVSRLWDYLLQRKGAAARTRAGKRGSAGSKSA
jgi:hypothetical protein